MNKKNLLNQNCKDFSRVNVSGSGFGLFWCGAMRIYSIEVLNNCTGTSTVPPH